MTNIIYRSDIEPDNVKELDKYINEFKWLIPTSIHNLYVDVQDVGNERHAIATSVTWEYRRANMTVYSAWFTAIPEDKTLHIIHDLLHTSNVAYSNFTEDVIRNLCSEDENKKLYGYLMEQSRLHLEGMTEDQAHAIYTKFGPIR